MRGSPARTDILFVRPLIVRLFFCLGAGLTVAGCGGGGGGGAVPQGAAAAIVPAQQSPGPSLTTPAPLATPTPGATLASVSQNHVLTGGYLGGTLGPTMNWSSAARYLTWAQTTIANADAVSAAGIKTQFYIDPARVQTDDALYTGDETTFAHDCSGNRVTDVYVWNGTPVTQYVTDVTSASMQRLFANRVSAIAQQAHFDAVFADDSGPLTPFQEEHPFTPGLPCGYTDAAWLAGGIALDHGSPIPVLVNGLHEVDLPTHSMSPSVGLLADANTVGGNFEECYGNASAPKQGGWFWQTTENTELAVAAQQKLFECMDEDRTPAASAADGRLYTYASFLLSYDPRTSVLWDFYTNPSGFTVEPETSLVALDPKVSAPSTILALLQPGGAYAREYGACYVGGAPVGPCAAVVNSNTDISVPFPFTAYKHSLTIAGGGVLDGGSISTAGGPPAANLPPLEAAIVFQ